MKNEIHEKCKERLISKLAEGLDSVKGANYRLDWFAYMNIGTLKLEEILDSKSREELQTYIREDALTLYVYDTLIDEIIENPIFKDYNEKKELYKISELEDTSVLATKIINSIDNLPLKLDFIFNLGKQFSEYINKGVQLSEKVLLTNDLSWLGDTFDLTHPIEKQNELIAKSNNSLSIPLTPKWENGNLYLLINSNGFVSNTGKTNTSFYAENLLKSFLGLMISSEILRFSYSQERIFNSQYYVFKDNVILSKVRLNDDLARSLDRLTLNTGLAGTLDSKKLTDALKLSIKLFEDDKECEKLRNACCWLFDSYCGENELLSFVQATVTLEILLGDKSESDKVGLGSLLKNRCAYLLGTTAEERSTILDEFEKIYTIRSKIVHRGHPKLNNSERGLLHKVRNLAKRVIIKELDLYNKIMTTVEYPKNAPSPSLIATLRELQVIR